MKPKDICPLPSRPVTVEEMRSNDEHRENQLWVLRNEMYYADTDDVDLINDNLGGVVIGLFRTRSGALDHLIEIDLGQEVFDTLEWIVLLTNADYYQGYGPGNQRQVLVSYAIGD